MPVVITNVPLKICLLDILFEEGLFSLEKLDRYLAKKLNVLKFPYDFPGEAMSEIVQALADFPVSRSGLARITSLDEELCIDVRMHLEEIAGYASGGESNWFTIHGLAGIEHCPNLESLVITLNDETQTEPVPVSLLPLGPLKKLVVLELYGHPCTSYTDCDTLLHLKNLRKLRISEALPDADNLFAQLRARGVEIA